MLVLELILLIVLISTQGADRQAFSWSGTSVNA